MAGEWVRHEWGEIATLEYGKSLRNYRSESGQYRVYGTNGPIGWHYEPLCTHPGVIVGRKGAYRGIHYSHEPFFVIDTAFYLEPKKEMNLRWAYYCLLTYDINGMDSGSAIPSTSREAFYRLPVSVPPLKEQQAIACILGALDDKIELNRRMNRTLEEMARAIFKSWFVDFDPVRTKAAGQQPPGLKPEIAALFPDSFEDSELGEIPKGWRVAPLGDLVELVKGRSYRSEELSPSDTALVTLKSFARGGGYRLDGLKPFTGSYKPEQVVEPGEVVLSCTDVTQAAEVIGRTALVRAGRAYSRLVASLDVLIIRPQRPLTRAFVYELGRSVAFVDHTYAHTTGTTVLHLSKDAVPTFRFAKPPAELIDSFDRVAAPFIQRIDAIEAESDLLAALRDTLLPKLISGELRIPDAERIAGRCL